ncbi:DNA-binding protein [Salimicrobium jeotgali]|uniref:DNA-binding protein n=1 Tax=Salimicrobium jeotgali TaxID=1230341 RepID=K2G7R2_9BACI|nr:helix-turn-helix domain-containing protein [Salimicrobium jeotgali]AKG05553.1 DNA-binding protein [Salimicrobium jeotgali]EKE30452.1 hypothetical protein MJ3_13464 [Salimicrobium jeotgali]MBM7696595.1 hypothetical protein [Salimicrobium jeotgali]
MFKAELQPEVGFSDKIYDMFYEIAERAQADVQKESELPYLLNKKQLAEHIFNVSTQTLDAHIIHRSDFPKVRVGDRALYPKDEVKTWIRKNLDTTHKVRDLGFSHKEAL